MENNCKCVLAKNQFMKKSFFIAITVLAGSVVFAQQKKEKQPPPPPPPPKIMEVKEIPPPPPPPPKPDVSEKTNYPEDYSGFLKRNPTVKGIGWTDNQVRIRLKSGKEEDYFLNDNGEMQKLKNQYGELPAPPPPPPKLVKVKTVS